MLTQDYKLKGNPVVPVEVPIVGNLIYDELGEAVLAQFNEKFKGVPNIEDTNKYQRNQPISYSNTPRALGLNQILMKETNGKIRVLSPSEVVQYWNSIPEKAGTYADTNAVAVFPKEGPNEDLRQRVLKLTGKTKLKTPLLVLNLGVEKADNNYGFTFTKTDSMKSVEAPYLEKDCSVKYDPEKGLIVSDEGVRIWTQSSQSGLRRVYLLRYENLNCWNDNLLDSIADGRVRVVQDPKGLAKNLDVLLAQLAKERDTQIAETNQRFEQASRFLKTGKI